MDSLLALVLAASPLLVRVLEAEHPVRAELEARQLQCDGTPLPPRVEVVPGRDTLEVGEARCAEVTAAGEVTIRVRGEAHRYPGTLRVTLVGGGLEVVNQVDVEGYLPGVVEAAWEGLGAPPRAALEAQAPVSRTFALASRRRHGTEGYGLCDVQHCQRYRGASESSGARAAVTATAGQVLLAGGVALRPAFFHPRAVGTPAGPRTSSARRLSGSRRPTWTWLAARRAVGVAPTSAGTSWRRGRTSPLRCASLPRGTPSRCSAGTSRARALEVRAFGKRMTGEALGVLVSGVFGAGSVPSAKWKVEEVESQVRFIGFGRGHGAGLCQAGAVVMARRRADWRTGNESLRWLSNSRSP